jgi:hypothetical protein
MLGGFALRWEGNRLLSGRLTGGDEFAAVLIPEDGKLYVEFAEACALAGREVLFASKTIEQLPLVGYTLDQFKCLVHFVPLHVRANLARRVRVCI